MVMGATLVNDVTVLPAPLRDYVLGLDLDNTDVYGDRAGWWIAYQLPTHPLYVRWITKADATNRAYIRNDVSDWVKYPPDSSLPFDVIDTAPVAEVRPPSCLYAGTRAPAADFAGFQVNTPMVERNAVRALAAQRRTEAMKKALATLKRTLPAWPVCKYGGELDIGWITASEGLTCEAYWHCSVCGSKK